MELDKVKEFRIKFNEVLKTSISTDDLLQEISIDSRIKFSEITPKFLRILDQFSPFGPGNLRPVFVAEGVRTANTPRIVGTNHLLASFRQNGSDKIFDSIGFNMGEHFKLIRENNCELDIVFSIDKTIRDNRIYPQLKLKDIKATS
jgi:single-stranded-DNA-specific exonuclease